MVLVAKENQNQFNEAELVKLYKLLEQSIILQKNNLQMQSRELRIIDGWAIVGGSALTLGKVNSILQWQAGQKS